MTGVDEAPAALLAAFDAYERALAANDLAALDASFARADDTIRSDDSGLLVGHGAISAFRAGRGGIRPRRISDIHYRRLGDTTALLVSESQYEDGGRGVQTQIWQSRGGGWVIIAAHVTARIRRLDRPGEP
ncbi:DUF3225 domain-containing protein [Microbacterium sp. QXD-8]|uniref:DUF3225 domain-containing protein n=1 Tax=Microbacterium psychrotolerans TaxID=3068321 RepID=A0ABU0Z521_9MICO|nr:AtzH-like domain-containing protein [Microbacterium sp. QXD-8]MDQ7878966.1 DUF3225 domain-containing protein [Microbacterium sp. QXD-8]